MPVRPLLERDYGLASRAMRALSTPGLTLADLNDLVAGLLPVFDAQDASVMLHDVPAKGRAALRPWFRHFDPTDMLRLIAQHPEGHRGMRAVHESGRRVMQFSDLPEAVHSAFMKSDFMQEFRNRSGLERVLVGHLGERPGESVGAINLYRATGRPPFDEERLFLFSTLHSALTDAARGVLLKAVCADEGDETALLNAAGKILWMTDGFPFLWNAANPRPLRREGLRLGELLARDASPLEHAVAFHVILLDVPSDSTGPTRAIRTEGPGPGITARFETRPGGPIGCGGRVLRVTLDRARPSTH